MNSNNPSNDLDTFDVPGGFSYSGTGVDALADVASEFTIVDVVLDLSGSVYSFADVLRKMLMTALLACQKSSMVDNFVVRSTGFSTRYPGNVVELHGYKPLAEINLDSYPKLECGGGTPEYDAVYSTVGSITNYAEYLKRDGDFRTNGVIFIIGDGFEEPAPPRNPSRATPAMIKKAMREAITDEKKGLESLVVIMIGINAKEHEADLRDFCVNVLGIDPDAKDGGYRDAGDVTEGNLAKLAGFISQSISSQAQARGTGGPSQNIAAKI